MNREDWKAINSWIQAVTEGLELLQLQTVAEMGGDILKFLLKGHPDARVWSDRC